MRFLLPLFVASLASCRPTVSVASRGLFASVDKLPAINKDHIEAINGNPASTWTAGVNEKFIGWTLADAKKLMGARTEGVKRLQKKTFPAEVKAVLPTNFDWRNSSSCVGPVLDQGACGSCWAFGAAESLSDRFCLHSNGTTRVALSEQNLVSCDNGNNGCEGGDLATAWDYMQSNGVVTQQCLPYAFPGCNPTPCLPPFQPTPPCTRTCANGASYSGDKHYAANVYSVGGWDGRAEDIMKEILENGPVEAAFSVYQDFLSYKSGVYSHNQGQLLGGHAIKIVGWGVTSANVKYWIVQNSWNVNWGMKGYFWIKRGVDECGIESNVVAGLPKLN